ncbi:MAG TPA: hypothetical protein VIE65_08535 [Methylobacter sp.]
MKARARSNYQQNAESRRSVASARYKLKREQIIEKRRKAWANNANIKNNRNAYWKSRKLLCYSTLGNACRLCQESDIDVLVIDHVNDDGSIERASGTSRLELWNKIIHRDGADRYQLLCFNCNLKKEILRPYSSPLGEYKFCPTCLKDTDLSLFKRDAKYKDGFYYECRVCIRRRDEAVKNLAFLRLGSSSCPCGISDPDCLTIDHINGDGYLNRRNDGAGISIYRKLVDGRIDRTRFQVLCMNCNIKKHLCPSLASHSDNFISPIEYRESSTIANDDCISFKIEDVILEKFDKQDPSVISFLDRHHYAGFGRYGTAIYCGFLHSEMIAIFKICPPVRNEVATSIGMSPRSILELDRVCLRPDCHKKNLLSNLLSRLVRLIRADFPEIKAIVSFADPNAGHDGTIYKAANWSFIGVSSRSYEYISKNGERIHKKTVYNAAKSRGMKEREYAELNMYARKYSVPKLKFMIKL